MGGRKGGVLTKDSTVHRIANVTFPLHLTINCGLPWKFKYTKSLRLKVKIADNLQYSRISLQVEIIITDIIEK